MFYTLIPDANFEQALIDLGIADAGIGLYANWVKDITANYSENCDGIMARGGAAVVNSTGKHLKGEETAIAQSLKIYPNPFPGYCY